MKNLYSGRVLVVDVESNKQAVGDIIDIKWIFDETKSEHTWGYKIDWVQSDIGLNYIYIPERFIVNLKEIENEIVEIPPQLSDDNIDLTALKNICKGYVESVITQGESDKDSEHYIFEEALETIYGKGIFNILNEYYI